MAKRDFLYPFRLLAKAKSKPVSPSPEPPPDSTSPLTLEDLSPQLSGSRPAPDSRPQRARELLPDLAPGRPGEEPRPEHPTPHAGLGQAPSGGPLDPADDPPPALVRPDIMGGLAMVLLIRVGLRAALYVAAMTGFEKYPNLALAIYALILADFLHHFMGSIVFGSIEEGLQAWLSLAGAGLLGWIDPNGLFGLDGMDPFQRRIVGVLVFGLLVGRLFGGLNAPSSESRRSWWQGAEAGPGYRPNHLSARIGRIARFVWNLV